MEVFMFSTTDLLVGLDIHSTRKGNLQITKHL